MTKTKINYENNVIYKICCKDTNIKDIYVGHTTCFTKRKYQHKCVSNNLNSKDYHLKVYQFINKNGGWDNWDMIEIEKFCCNDGNEARARERYNIEQLGATLNIKLPTRTMKEYLESVNDKLTNYRKEYNKTNKAIINTLNNQNYQNKKVQILEKQKIKFDCLCGSKCRIADKEKHFRSKKHQKYINSLPSI